MTFGWRSDTGRDRPCPLLGTSLAREPLYDIKENRWIEEWANEVAPGLALPRLLWPSEVAREATTAAAEVTGIPTGTPVAAGTIDPWSEAMSVGVREPGDMMLMYGTTMSMVEVLSETQANPSLWGTTGLFPGARNWPSGWPPWEHSRPGSKGLRRPAIREARGRGRRSRIGFERSRRAVVLCWGTNPTLRPRGARGYLQPHPRPQTRPPLPRPARGHGLRRAPHPRSDASGRRRGKETGRRGGGTKGGLWTRIVSDVTGKTQELPKETIGAS